MNISNIIWNSAGRPYGNKRTPVAGIFGPCAICGSSAINEYVPRKIGLPKSFQNYDQLKCPHADGVCVACAWSMGGRPPNTLRMWSVVAAPGAGKWERKNEGPDLGPDAVAIRGEDHVHVVRMLMGASPAGPWGVALADSGKLHVVPWTPANIGAVSWAVRFEAITVTTSTGDFQAATTAIAALLRAGFPIAHIRACDTTPPLLTKCGLELWRQKMDVLRPLGGARQLALFLLAQSARGKKKEVWNEW